MAAADKIKHTKNYNCGWLDLHVDLWHLIFACLGCKDRCVFKSVCKIWSFIASSLSIDLPACESPCLMMMVYDDDDKERNWNLFHPIHKEYYKLGFSQLLKDTIILHSNLGWLLVSGKDRDYLFFYNPMTGQKMDLPPFSFSKGYEYLIFGSFSPITIVSASFSSAPTESNCIIFGIFGIIRGKFMDGYGLFHFGQGNKHWLMYQNRRILYNKAETMGYCSPIVTDSKVYYTQIPCSLLVIELLSLDEKCYEYYYNQFDTPFAPELRESYLVNVDVGEIWGIFLTKRNANNYDDDGKRCIWVYRVVHKVKQNSYDLEKYTWELMSDLENKCLYVGKNGSFASEAGGGKGKPNTIYFNYMDGETGGIASCSYVRMPDKCIQCHCHPGSRPKECLVIDSHYPPTKETWTWVQQNYSLISPI